MAKVFSWKLDDSNYAYLVKQNGSYISPRLSYDESVAMAETVKGMSATEYANAYALMNAEIKSIYGTGLSESWQPYYDSGMTDVVILTGKDGESKRGSGGYESDGEWGGDDYDYEALNEYIESIFKPLRERLEAENREILNQIEEMAVARLNEAKATLAEAREKIDAVKSYLDAKYDNATEALSAIRNLFAGGNFTEEELMAALTKTTEADEWITANSGFVTSLKTGVDEAAQRAGLIGEGEDATKGLFTWFGESIDALSGTVGTVESTMDASQGKISQIATWYDENAESAAEAGRFINASSATIEDVIKYTQGSGYTSVISRQMDALHATITDEITAASGETLITMQNYMNAQLGTWKQDITASVEDSITSMGTDWNAISGTMEQYLLKVNELSGTAMSLSDKWDANDGMLRSVSNLVAETDEDGNILYFYSGTTGPEQSVIYDAINKKFYLGTTKISSGSVYCHWDTLMASYIKQTASAISMTVSSDDAIAAQIKMELSGDSGFIYTIATAAYHDVETSIFNGDIIAKALSANSADIGGIMIGKGHIYHSGTSGYSFDLDGTTGKLTAQDAEIKGSISADTGYFSGELRAATGNFSGAVYASSLILGTGASSDIDNKISQGVTNALGNSVEAAVSAYCQDHGITAGDKVTVETSSTEVCGETIYTQDIYVNSAKVGTTFSVSGQPFVYTNIGLGTSGGTYVKIQKDGLLQANNAIINGAIYATSGFFGSLHLGDGGTVYAGNSGTSSSDSNSFFDADGNLHCKKGTFEGTITAKGGEIGNFELTEGTLEGDESAAITFKNSDGNEVVVVDGSRGFLLNDESGNPVTSITNKSYGPKTFVSNNTESSATITFKGSQYSSGIAYTIGEQSNPYIDFNQSSLSQLVLSSEDSKLWKVSGTISFSGVASGTSGFNMTGGKIYAKIGDYLISNSDLTISDKEGTGTLNSSFNLIVKAGSYHIIAGIQATCYPTGSDNFTINMGLSSIPTSIEIKYEPFNQRSELFANGFGYAADKNNYIIGCYTGNSINFDIKNESGYSVSFSNTSMKGTHYDGGTKISSNFYLNPIALAFNCNSSGVIINQFSQQGWKVSSGSYTKVYSADSTSISGYVFNISGSNGGVVTELSACTIIATPNILTPSNTLYALSAYITDNTLRVIPRSQAQKDTSFAKIPFSILILKGWTQ